MENMDKGLAVPKWVLINRTKIPQNLSARIIYPSPKLWDFDEKRLHCTSLVRDCIFLNYFPIWLQTNVSIKLNLMEIHSYLCFNDQPKIFVQ